jgi:hypothetical protein
MRGTGVTTIADCKVVANLIVEEWLVRDNATAMWQVGADPRTVGRRRSGGQGRRQSRHAWRAEAIAGATAHQAGRGESRKGHPADRLPRMLRQHLPRISMARAALLSPCAEGGGPRAAHGFGGPSGLLHDAAEQCPARSGVPLEHVCRPAPAPRRCRGGALRWSLAAATRGWALGEPSGRELWAARRYRIIGLREVL